MESRVSKDPAQIQSSTLPPAQPAYILRGHTAQIHAVHFLRQNLRLLTGDADGWVILWDVPIKRPVAVWKPHNGTVLGFGCWGDGEEKVITHGRDNHIHVWQVRAEDEPNFSKVLPVEDATSSRPAPWLLHTLPVNSLNFCSFAMCHHLSDQHAILIAVPGVQDGMINITSLPSETRIATIPTPRDLPHTGMLMAVALAYIDSSLTVLAGYETGHVARWTQNATQHWTCTYLHKSHSQPVLSLAMAPGLGFAFSSSADAIVARHPLRAGDGDEAKVMQTKHAGQQSLVVRSDENIFATSGWDGRVRVYSPKTMRELAILKWHQEGCYAVTFAQINEGDEQAHQPAPEDLDARGGSEKLSTTVSARRTAKASTTHWLAAGSKDGKVSLWDIY